MAEIPDPPDSRDSSNELPEPPFVQPLTHDRRSAWATIAPIFGIMLLAGICGCMAFGYWGLSSTAQRMEEFNRHSAERLREMREASGSGPLYMPSCPMAAVNQAMDQERKAIRHAIETDLAGMREEAERLPGDSLQRRELMERIHATHLEIQALETRPHTSAPDIDP